MYELDRYVLDFSQLTVPFTKEQLFELCVTNKKMAIEWSAKKELIIMPPTGTETGSYELNAGSILWNWAKRTGLGIGFSSSAGFTMPNGSMRSPDAAWITTERWNALTKEEKKKFAPICPDFVIEIRSESQLLKHCQEKMLEWIENGCRLAWMIDSVEQKAYIYRPNKVVEIVNSFENCLKGEDVLPEFELDLRILLT